MGEEGDGRKQAQGDQTASRRIRRNQIGAKHGNVMTGAMYMIRCACRRVSELQAVVSCTLVRGPIANAGIVRNFLGSARVARIARSRSCGEPRPAG